MIKENSISAFREILVALSAIVIFILSHPAHASDISPLRVKVLVGNSQESSGRAVASLLESEGFKVETVDKAPSSSFSEDTIFFKSGSRSAAKDMARAMGDGVVLKPLTWESVFDVIVVTGRLRGASGAVAEAPPAEVAPDAGPAAQADKDVPAVSPEPMSLGLADEQSQGLAGRGEGDNYVIGPQDVLQITVWDNKDLSGKVSVSIEGYINYQLIGMVKAAGLTSGMLARKITDLLADGYLVDPQVSVEVDEYKSKKVYIIGEVTKPGTYYLTRKTTFLEAISMAGGPTKDADREVIVVRPKTGEAGEEPVLPENADRGEMIPVDIKSALEGDLSQNIFVEGGDSIYVQKAKTFFIMGEVRSPGQYKLDAGTTVRKAISLGGGATEKASMGRTRVVRIVDGKEVQKRVEMDEPVLPNDTVVVPESFF